MSELLLINGELVDGEEIIDVYDPSTGEPFTTVPKASKQQAEEAIAAAKVAQRAWAAAPESERRAALVSFADAINANAEELAQSLTKEQGKPIADARTEVQYADFFVRQFASFELPVQVIQDDDAMRIEMHHKPLGVVVGITAWNFPLLIACYKIAPAVLLGNTFILKPAPTTPVTSLILGRLAKEVFPAGVVNVLTDAGDLGPVLTGHPDVAKISFTGSTPTGKKVMESASSTLKRLTLELGGNDPAIILDDVDVATVAPALFQTAMANCGQVCIALKRVYAPASIYDQLVDALVECANKAVIGSGLEDGTEIGPLQNKTQFEKAKDFLKSAKKDGKIVAGGTVADRPGYFIQPTIVRDITDGSELVDKEQFAPILPVIKYDDLDEAIDRANGTEYGLGGSVWSSNHERAYDVAKRIDSGTVWINHHLHFGPHIPFGGSKNSGIGVEFGEAGLAEYSQMSIISIAK